MFSSAQAATSTLYRQSTDVREDLGKSTRTVLKNKSCFQRNKLKDDGLDSSSREYGPWVRSLKRKEKTSDREGFTDEAGGC